MYRVVQSGSNTSPINTDTTQSAWAQLRVDDVAEMQTRLVSLTPYTVYEVRMASVNEIGASNLTQSVFATTYEDGRDIV